VQHFQATFAISVRRAAGLRGWGATTPEGIETATPYRGPSRLRSWTMRRLPQ